MFDRAGALIVYQENVTSWAGALAFSSEAKAHEFLAASKLEVAELGAVASGDRDSIATLIRQVKKRAVRNLLLDLDYRTGECTIIEFEGDALGTMRPWQFTRKEGK
jgi:hypothetical protein